MLVKNSNDTIGDRTRDLPGKRAGGFQSVMSRNRRNGVRLGGGGGDVAAGLQPFPQPKFKRKQVLLT
jgi:hypothetical protein